MGALCRAEAEEEEPLPSLSSLHTVECRSSVAALFVELEGLCRGGSLCVTNNITLIIWARKPRLIFWF